MRRKLSTLAVIGLLATAVMTGCDRTESTALAGNETTTVGKGDGTPRVGVILPDTKTSQRWVSEDPKYLQQAFDEAHVPVEIENAGGDRAAFVKIAQNMVDNGVKVLIIASLDADSGGAALAAAKARKVPTIDYDRLTLGGGADYYVSFDNVKVGQLQSYGLARCLTARKIAHPVIAELNGSPTDNNATLFKEGYDEFLQDQYDKAAYRKGPDQWVPDWDIAQGGVIFEQMLSQRPDIDGVLAANDGLAGAVIQVLKKHGLNGKVPVTGQDATIPGLQALLTGDQCMTIYKAIRPEAYSAADLAVHLFHGDRPTLGTGERIKDPQSGVYVPFRSLAPQEITVDDIPVVVADGFVTVKQLCTPAYVKACRAAGLVK